MSNFMTPLEVQLGLGLALLIGLAIGWVARGWGERYERLREDRNIEKAGVWRRLVGAINFSVVFLF